MSALLSMPEVCQRMGARECAKSRVSGARIAHADASTRCSLNETCHFLAIDFDKDGWQDDAVAFFETCRRFDAPVALERSRSGRGGHVWMFFDRAIPAALARRLGSFLLTETLERRPDIGLE